MSTPAPRSISARRLSRRTALRLGAMAGAGVAASSAFACNTGKKPAGSPSGSASTAGQQPKRGGRLTFAGGFAGSYDSMGTGFDPATQLQFAVRGFTLFYQRLVAYNLETLATEPEIAQKWEQPSPT